MSSMTASWIVGLVRLRAESVQSLCLRPHVHLETGWRRSKARQTAFVCRSSGARQSACFKRGLIEVQHRAMSGVGMTARPPSAVCQAMWASCGDRCCARGRSARSSEVVFCRRSFHALPPHTHICLYLVLFWLPCPSRLQAETVLVPRLRATSTQNQLGPLSGCGEAIPNTYAHMRCCSSKQHFPVVLFF